MNELRDNLNEAITTYIKTRLPEFDEASHSDVSFSKLGLDSLGHVELSAVIESSSKLTVEPDIAFNYPTVNALTGFVCGAIEEAGSNTREGDHDKV